MNHDLIKQLQALTPDITNEEESELQLLRLLQADTTRWLSMEEFNRISELANKQRDHDKVYELAPTMRTEILAMAKEIEELNNKIHNTAFPCLDYLHGQTRCSEQCENCKP